MKGIHIIGFVFWAAGLTATVAVATAGGREAARKPLRSLVHPGMGMAFAGGIGMIVMHAQLLKQMWLHGKFALLLALLAVTIFIGRAIRRDTPVDRLRRLGLAARILAIAIILLAVLRPF